MGVRRAAAAAVGPGGGDLLKEVAQALGIGRDEIVDAEWADNGPGWVALLLGTPRRCSP